MSLRGRIVVAMLWVLSLLAVASFAMAQAQWPNPLPEPIVLSGGEIGFRVEGMIFDTPVGRLVVRLNGEWVEPRFGGGPGPGARPVDAKPGADVR